MDPVLIPILEAADEESRQGEFERLLVEHAQPTIETVIARFSRSEWAMGRDDAEDIAATAALRVVRKLQAIEQENVDDLENYVATLTYRTIYDYMRRRFPERTRLKNRIRYLLDHDSRLAMWPTPESIACGMAMWKGRTDVLSSFDVEPESVSSAMLDANRPYEAASEIFRRAGAPLPLEMLVRILARLWNVAEARTEAIGGTLLEHRPSHASTHETRQFLQVLWNEIKLLQPNHRVALLLNLRDPEGVNAIALFALVGVAELDDIARVLSMSLEELEAIWQSLPLDDQAIAERLNLTRQQVINLRRSARERLARGTFMWKKYERRRG